MKREILFSAKIFEIEFGKCCRLAKSMTNFAKHFSHSVWWANWFGVTHPTIVCVRNAVTANTSTANGQFKLEFPYNLRKSPWVDAMQWWIQVNSVRGGVRFTLGAWPYPYWDRRRRRRLYRIVDISLCGHCHIHSTWNVYNYSRAYDERRLPIHIHATTTTHFEYMKGAPTHTHAHGRNEWANVSHTLGVGARDESLCSV